MSATYSDGAAPMIGDVIECVGLDYLHLYFDRGDRLTIENIFDGLLKFKNLTGLYNPREFRVVEPAATKGGE